MKVVLNAGSRLGSDVELAHVTAGNNSGEDCMETIAFPGPVSLSFVEVGMSERDGAPAAAKVLLFAKDSSCTATARFLELQDGLVSAPGDSFLRVDAQGIVTDQLVVRGRLFKLSVRVVGRVLTDPDPTNTMGTSLSSASTTFPSDPSQMPQLPDVPGPSGEAPVALPSFTCFPLAAYPTDYASALERTAALWAAVGMSVAGNWPRVVIRAFKGTLHLLTSSSAEIESSLTDVLANGFPAPHRSQSTAGGSRPGAQARVQEESPVAAAGAQEDDRVHLPGVDFRRSPGVDAVTLAGAIVAWLGLLSGVATAGPRYVDLGRLALSAAAILCVTQPGAMLFLRCGGAARLAQLLHEFEKVPNAPFVRAAVLVLELLTLAHGPLACSALLESWKPTEGLDDKELLPPAWAPRETPPSPTPDAHHDQHYSNASSGSAPSLDDGRNEVATNGFAHHRANASQQRDDQESDVTQPQIDNASDAIEQRELRGSGADDASAPGPPGTDAVSADAAQSAGGRDAANGRSAGADSVAGAQLPSDREVRHQPHAAAAESSGRARDNVASPRSVGSRGRASDANQDAMRPETETSGQQEREGSGMPSASPDSAAGLSRQTSSSLSFGSDDEDDYELDAVQDDASARRSLGPGGGEDRDSAASARVHDDGVRQADGSPRRGSNAGAQSLHDDEINDSADTSPAARIKRGRSGEGGGTAEDDPDAGSPRHKSRRFGSANGRLPSRSPPMHERPSQSATSQADDAEEEVQLVVDPVDVMPASSHHLPSLAELLTAALTTPQADRAVLSSARIAARLAAYEAASAFDSAVDGLIGRAQRSNAIDVLEVTDLLDRLQRSLQALAAGLSRLDTPVGSTPDAPLDSAPLAPAIPPGDPCILHVLLERGVLLRCAQALQLPPLLVNGLSQHRAEGKAAEEDARLERSLLSPVLKGLEVLVHALTASRGGIALLHHERVACQQIIAALESRASPAPTKAQRKATQLHTDIDVALRSTLTAICDANRAVAAAIDDAAPASQVMQALLSLCNTPEGGKAAAAAALAAPSFVPWLCMHVYAGIATDIIAEDPSITKASGMLPHGVQHALRSFLSLRTPSTDALAAALSLSVLQKLLAASPVPLVDTPWAPFLSELLENASVHPAVRDDAIVRDVFQQQKDELAFTKTTDAVEALAGRDTLTGELGCSRLDAVSEALGTLHVSSLHSSRGLPAILELLDATLVPFFAKDVNDRLALGTVDWTNGSVALCDPADKRFLRLLTSPLARSAAITALAHVHAAIRASSAHAMTVHGAGGLNVLSRSVGVAVTWLARARGSRARAHVSGEAGDMTLAIARERQALDLLHESTRALCRLVRYVLATFWPDAKQNPKRSCELHARWRTVCTVLLAAYHALLWCPENVDAFCGGRGAVTAPIVTRHAIVHALQDWVESEHVISPISIALRAGSTAKPPLLRPAHMLPVDDRVEFVASMHSWHQPAALATLFALLGDVFPPEWPSSSAVASGQIEPMTYRSLKTAICAAFQAFVPDIPSLVSIAASSSSPLLLSAFTRAAGRACGCGGGMAYLLVPNLHRDLKQWLDAHTSGHAASAAAQLSRSALMRLHALLVTIVALLRWPMVKAVLLEHELHKVLYELLHDLVRRWTSVRASDTTTAWTHAVYDRLTGLTLAAISVLLNPEVTMEPARPAAERVQNDLPPARELSELVGSIIICLPFLSSAAKTAAVALNQLLAPQVVSDPLLLASLKAVGDLVANELEEEDIRALGTMAASLTATPQSRLRFAADETLARAQRYTASAPRRGAGVSGDAVVAACRRAGDFLVRVEALAAARADLGDYAGFRVGLHERKKAIDVFKEYCKASESEAGPAGARLPWDELGPETLLSDASLLWFGAHMARFTISARRPPAEVIDAPGMSRVSALEIMPPALDPPRRRMAAAMPELPALPRRAEAGPAVKAEQSPRQQVKEESAAEPKTPPAARKPSAASELLSPPSSSGSLAAHLYSDLPGIPPTRRKPSTSLDTAPTMGAALSGSMSDAPGHAHAHAAASRQYLPPPAPVPKAEHEALPPGLGPHGLSTLPTHLAPVQHVPAPSAPAGPGAQPTTRPAGPPLAIRPAGPPPALPHAPAPAAPQAVQPRAAAAGATPADLSALKAVMGDREKLRALLEQQPHLKKALWQLLQARK